MHLFHKLKTENNNNTTSKLTFQLRIEMSPTNSSYIKCAVEIIWLLLLFHRKCAGEMSVGNSEQAC